MYHNVISSEAPLICSTAETLLLPKVCGSLLGTQIESLLGCGRIVAWSCQADVDKIRPESSGKGREALEGTGIAHLPALCEKALLEEMLSSSHLHLDLCLFHVPMLSLESKVPS